MEPLANLFLRVTSALEDRVQQVFTGTYEQPVGGKLGRVSIGRCIQAVDAARFSNHNKGSSVIVVGSNAGTHQTGYAILPAPPGNPGPASVATLKISGESFKAPEVPPYIVFVRDGTDLSSTTYAITLDETGNPIEIIDSRVLGLEALFGIMWGNTFVITFRTGPTGQTRQGMHAWNPFAQQFATYNYDGPPDFNNIVATTSGPCVGRDGKLYWIEMEFDDILKTHDWVLISTEDRSLNGLDRFISLTNLNTTFGTGNPDALNPSFLEGNQFAQLQQGIWDAGSDIIRGHVTLQWWCLSCNPDQKFNTLFYINLHKTSSASSFETFVESDASTTFGDPPPYSHNGYWSEFGTSPLSQCSIYGPETIHGVKVWPLGAPTEHSSTTDTIFIAGSLHEDGDFVSLCRLRPTTTDGQGSLRFGLPDGSPSVTVVNIPALDAFVGNPGTYVLVGGGKVSALPEVSITAPPEGSSFIFGAFTNFIGNAFSAKFGDISSDIKWSSDLDGPLGPLGGGASIFVILTIGAHVVTAAVEDSDMNAGQATVRVTVTAS